MSFTPCRLLLILLSVWHRCYKSWSSQTDDGTIGEASRSGYGTIPVQMFRLWCDLKAVLLSLFSCCSRYSVQQHLTHILSKVKTPCVHIGIILRIVTRVQVNLVGFVYRFVFFCHQKSVFTAAVVLV